MKFARIVFLAPLCASLPHLALAQDSKPAEATQPRKANRLLEEVLVTAQKREENIQDVPLSISAYSPEKLDAFGIESAQDLERITPGLTITNSAGYSLAYLRGVGTDAFLPGADTSVPFYIDGVPLVGSQGSADTLGRVERVEVLKGPQGTLFGRNATGGAVSIVTPEPGPEFTGDIKLEAAKYNERNAIFFVNVPVMDSLAFTLSAYKNERDNYLSNDAGPVIDVYSEGLRGKLRWDINDSIAITLAASEGETSNNAAIAFENTLPAPRVAGVSPLPADSKADRRINNDQLSGARNQHELYSLKLDWATEWVDMKLTLSDQELFADFIQADFDGSPLPLVTFYSVNQVAEQKTAELQFTSTPKSSLNDRLDWVAGLFYLDGYGGFDPLALDIGNGLLDETLGLGGLANVVNDLLATLNLPQLGEQVRLLTGGILDTESISVYGQGDYALRSNLAFTLGLRYQEERRNLLRSRLALQNADGSEMTLRNDDVPELRAYQWSPRVALSWFPFDGETQLYASYGMTFKSPTYNTVNLTETPSPVDEETVQSAELGFKTTLLDQSLQLNGAIFYTEQDDLLTGLVAVASGGIVSYDNAGSAEIKGAELDFIWTPMPTSNPGLVVAGAASYLDTEYTDYPDGRGFDEATGVAFGDGLTNVLPSRDFTGNRIVRTPELTYTLAVNQSINLAYNHVLELGADVYYNDGFFFLPQSSDLYARESYHLVNARVSYFYEPWDIQLTVFGENVTDVTYNEAVFVADLGRNQILNAPRVFGARVNWTF